MADHHPELTESLARHDRFKAELAAADPVTRAQLLAAWKEQIIDQCVAFLRATDDVDSISNVDRAIAVGMDIIGMKEKDSRADQGS